MKVLLITHNPISTNNNMGKTFLSLFTKFEREELCQIYVFPTLPDVDICNSYYRITDTDVLYALPRFASPGGEITHEAISFYIAQKGCSAQISRRGSSSPFKRIARDCMWNLSRWCSRELSDWLERERPDCIFLAPGYAKFIYDIALKISRKRNIPIIAYICDDYYFVKKTSGLLNNIQLFLLKGKITDLMSNTSTVIAISPEIQAEYYNRFLVSSELIMTGSTSIAKPLSKWRSSCKLSYFGNLDNGRENALADIGKVLTEINHETKSSFQLDIYTASNDPRILSVFDSIETIKIHGFVAGDDFRDALQGSKALIHVEAFDKKNVDVVKHSVSTKIADSLASGIPLFAYAPDGISSTAHLFRNECAIIATSFDLLRDKLEVLLFDVKESERVVNNAICVAGVFHDCEKNSAKLKGILEGVLKNE